MKLLRSQDLPAALEKSLNEVTSGCSQCKRCVRDCAFLKSYGDPYELARKFQARQLTTRVIFSCSLCQLCSVVCTENIDPYRMFWLLRGWAALQGQVDYAKFRGILNYERWGFSALLRHQAIPAGCRSLFFPGCALAGSRPRQLRYVIKQLAAIVPSVGVLLRCCGKPSHDLGRLDYFAEKFTALLGYLAAQGIETVLTACPSCHQVFQQYATTIEVKSIYQIIGTAGILPQPASAKNIRIHDPCNARYDQKTQQSIRLLVDSMGLKYQEMKHFGKTTYCCGAGGSVARVDQNLARCWAKKRGQETDGLEVITYCGGCTDFLSRTMAVRHLLDILMEQDPENSQPVSVSRFPQTYLNRLILKFTLWRDFRNKRADEHACLHTMRDRFSTAK